MKSGVYTAIAAVVLMGNPQTGVAQTGEPGGTPEAALQALTNPDEYAWRLFLHLNRQAKTGIAGEPDPSKTNLRQYDPDRPVVWESWALASGLDLDFSAGAPPFPILRNVSEVFKNPATAPAPWEQLERGPAQQKVLSQDLKRLGVTLGRLGVSALARPASMARGSSFRILVAPSGSDAANDETRMNKSTYETVRSKRLWSVEGIEGAFAKAAKTGDKFAFELEQMSKEVKARWIPLTACNSEPNCADRNRYHWRTVDNPGTGQKEIWGLASLHVITRDLPNWFWSDFGHVDCEKSVGACAGQGLPAEIPLVDKTTNGPGGTPGPSGSGGIRTETIGSKWENYRLRGTQIEYVRTDGQATILSNPIIESTFQRSSCITCHSYASVGTAKEVPNDGTSLPLLTGKAGVKNVGSQSGDIGPPKCQRFFRPGGLPTGECPDIFDTAAPLYLHTDFLWSIPFRAFSEKP
jgi:hypothetical protein